MLSFNVENVVIESTKVCRIVQYQCFCLATGLTTCMMCKVDWNWVKWARVRRPGSGIQEYFIAVVKLCERMQRKSDMQFFSSRHSSGKISCSPLQNTTHSKMTTVPCSWRPSSVRSRQCWANIMKPENARLVPSGWVTAPNEGVQVS